MIRPATAADVDALVAIEHECFTTDRIARRQFRYLLTKGHAVILVGAHEGRIVADGVILYSRGTSMARLYSIAVTAAARGQGIAKALVGTAERAAIERECISMRLEVRQDNAASLGLFRALGYRQFEVRAGYYEDGTDAVRFEKSLAPQSAPKMARVPYYEQTLEFTCGPASLMMAMHALDASIPLERRLELRLWREATTIFMTSGHGGCGPFGLALSAHHRGFAVDLFVNEEGDFLVDSVRSPEKKTVMRLVQQDFLDEIRESDIQLNYRPIGLPELREKIDRGAIALVLISSYRIYQEKFPHWVVVTGFDDHFVYVHDPFVDYETGETEMDSMNMPILRKEFSRMTRYGKAGLKAVIVLSKTDPPQEDAAA